MTGTDFKDIITAISAVGFPIVMALLLFWQNVKQTADYTKNLTELVEKIDAKFDEMQNKMNGDDKK